MASTTEKWQSTFNILHLIYLCLNIYPSSLNCSREFARFKNNGCGLTVLQFKITENKIKLLGTRKKPALMTVRYVNRNEIA